MGLRVWGLGLTCPCDVAFQCQIATWKGLVGLNFIVWVLRCGGGLRRRSGFCVFRFGAWGLGCRSMPHRLVEKRGGRLACTLSSLFLPHSFSATRKDAGSTLQRGRISSPFTQNPAPCTLVTACRKLNAYWRVVSGECR